MIEGQHSGPRREDFVIGGWRVEPDSNRIFHCGGGVDECEAVDCEARSLAPTLSHGR